MDTVELEFIGTRKLALIFGGIKPQTIHKSLCLRGNYLGLVPKKLQNGRLIWKVDEVYKAINK